MTDSSNDLKPLLLEVLKTVQSIRDDHEKRFDGIERRLDQMDARFDGVDRRLDQMDARFDGVDRRLDQMDSRFDQMVGRQDQTDGRLDQIVSEQKQIKEMIGNVRLKEIGRLDGRIDQLAQDVAFGRRGVA